MQYNFVATTFLHLVFSWFQLGNFYLAFYFLFYGPTRSLDSDPFNGGGSTVFDTVRTLYIFGIVTLFISALGNRPQGSKWLYYSISILFAVLMSMMLFMGMIHIFKSGVFAVITASQDFADSQQNFIIYLVQNSTFRDMVIASLATFGLYVLSSLIYMDGKTLTLY